LRIGIIGAGKLGSALIKGLLSRQDTSLRVIASARSTRSLERIKSLGVEVTHDNKYLVSVSDIVIICVKPSQVEEVADEVSCCGKGKVIISAVALVPLKWWEVRFPAGDVKLFRVMPNINVLVGESFTALTAHDGADSFSRSLVEELFKLLGSTAWVSEEVLDALTLISGCGPAIIAEITDALVLASLAIGIPQEVAEEAVLKLIEGSAKSLQEVELTKFRNMVITPRGLTVRLLRRLYKENFKSTLIESIESTYSVLAESKIRMLKDML